MVAENVKYLLEKGLKVAMMVTSKKAAKFIHASILKAGFKSSVYHGDDADIEKQEEYNIITQCDKKAADFKQVAIAWK